MLWFYPARSAYGPMQHRLAAIAPDEGTLMDILPRAVWKGKRISVGFYWHHFEVQ